MTRRSFVGCSVAAMAAAPSDRITVGIVGSGLRAMFETRQYAWFDNAVIVAVSDAQESRRRSAKEILENEYAQQGRPNRGIRMYRDFRELLGQTDIDAVYIASPDHWHVSMLIPSLRAGKHVHCEKPLGVSIEQDLAALQAVRKYKKVFQYGSELRAFDEARQGIELVVNGRIGKVQRIYAVSPGSASGGSATPVTHPPAGFDYDAWLGPAPMKPFCADRCLTDAPRGIFNISDYTLGNIANWAAHPLDQVQRWADAVGRKDPPVRYAGSGTFPSAGLFDTSLAWNVVCTWADGLEMHFMDGGTYDALPGVPHPMPKMPNGAVFVGSEGWVVVNYGKVFTKPASLMNSVIGAAEIQIPHSVAAKLPEGLPEGFQQGLTAAHHQNWIGAIRHGGAVAVDIESAFRSDMVSQLAELCIRSEAPVVWDPEKATVVGNEVARTMMRRPMRDPWGVS